MPRKNLKVLGNTGHPNKARLSCTHNWECASQYARVVTTLDGSFHIGEVQFFFRSDHTGAEHAYALVSVWSDPDMDLLRDSSEMVYSCTYRSNACLHVIDVKMITSVVAMIPMMPCDGDCSSHFFLPKKPGLEIQRLGDSMNTDNMDE